MYFQNPHLRSEYDRFRKYTAPAHDTQTRREDVSPPPKNARVTLREWRNHLGPRLRSRGAIVTVSALILATLAVWFVQRRSGRTPLTLPGEGLVLPTVSASVPPETSSTLSPSPSNAVAEKAQNDSKSEVPSGSSFQIVDITTTGDSDSNSNADVQLRIAVQSRSDVRVDPVRR